MKVQCIKEIEGLKKDCIYKVQRVSVVKQQIVYLIVDDNNVLRWLSTNIIKPYINEKILYKK
jgi:hypothetical protein